MKKLAVLDIGSSKIRVAVISSNAKTFSVVGYGECEYAGFCEGEFLEEDGLKYAFGLALSNAEASANFHIKELYVGLPAEFLTVVNKTATLQLGSKRKVVQSDLQILFDQANDFKYNSDLTLIDVTTLEFALDNGKKLDDPLGKKTEKLTGDLSYQLANSQVINLLNNVFENLGLTSVEYVSSPLCECLALLDENARKDYALIIDCGYISTHIAICKGGGLAYLGSFSLGGGHIMADLAEVLELNYNDAETLKRKLVLTVENNEQTYEIPGGQPVNAILANDVAKSRISMICQVIEKCIELSNINYPKYFPVFLTGGGLSMMKGVKEEVSKELGRSVEILNSNTPQFTRPFNTSLTSICQMAFEKNKKANNSILSKIFKR